MGKIIKQITLSFILLLFSFLLCAYTSPSQVSIPRKVDETIRFNAEQKYPDDYQMQLHEINSQKDSYKRIQSWLSESGRTKKEKEIQKYAEQEYSEDWVMQLYEIKCQVRAYNILENNK